MVLIVIGLAIVGTQGGHVFGSLVWFDPLYGPDAGTVFFIIAFGYFAVRQPAVFQASSGPMAQPWLDPELTIEDLATVLRLPKHHLTQVINERLGIPDSIRSWAWPWTAVSIPSPRSIPFSRK